METSFGQVSASEQTEQLRHQVQFSGRTGEYFGIWIVNVVLGILTLGLYSAWAKVRTWRYFYANTRIDGSSFEYLARPLAILKGRLIAYAVVILFFVTERFAPLFNLVLIVLLMGLMPCVIVLGLRFRARNSAWRGLRFSFHRSLGSAYGPYLGWQLLMMLSFTLLYPFMRLRQHDFVVSGHRFGQESFHFEGTAGRYYPPYLIGFVLMAGVLLLYFVVLAVVMVVAMEQGGMEDPDQFTQTFVWLLVPVMATMYLGFFVVGVFLRVRYANLMWNHSRLGAHRFESSLRTRDMLWIYFSNIVAILCTLGLAVPWARIRLARYRAAHFAVLAQGTLDDFKAAAGDEPGATGAELIEALDMDLGIEF